MDTPDKVKQQTDELKNAITTLESQRAVLGDAVVEASLSALRKQLADLEQERHKKIVSMLFLDVVGSTALSQNLEPDEILEIMDGSLQRLAVPVEAHGGHVTRFMGDGFKAVFGEPTTRENDAEMAVRAGLEIIEEAKAIAAELEDKWKVTGFNVRVGVNTGMVAIGGLTESDDTVMGLTVNLGARLESAAPPGGLLISQETYRHVRGIFDTEPLAPITAKGFDEPVQVYLVTGSKPKAFRTGTRGIEGVNTRMIGRDGEFKRLKDAYFAAVEDNQCQVVTVIGDAGIGKSRLLEEFELWLEHREEASLPFTGRSGPEFKDSPYAILRDMFSHRFQVHSSNTVSEIQGIFETNICQSLLHDEECRMQAHFIGQLLGFDFSDSPYLTGVRDDAMQLRDRAWLYLSSYFKEIAGPAPVIIFLDDIHWADESSLDLINYLAQSLSGQPLLVICLGRSLLLERRPLWGEGQSFHTRINLLPLSNRDCRHLVEDILQKMGQVPLALRELVVNGAEGNPFYIEELIKMLIDSGVINTHGEHWQVEPTSLASILANLDVPSTLTALLQARLDQLVPGEKRLLQQASVVGRVFWDDVIRYISAAADGQIEEQADISDLLDALRSKEMIYHRETSSLDRAQEYSFKNAILREVTYDTILKKIRRSYHAQVAEWLLQEEVFRAGKFTGLLAEHLELAGDTQHAASYFRQAGEQAASQYANQSALRLLGHALELVPDTDLEERYACLLAREQVFSLLGSRKEQEQDLAQLVDLLTQFQDQAKLAEVALLQAAASSQQSDYSRVILHAGKVIEISKSIQLQEFEIKAHILWGRALLSQGDYHGAEEHFSEASRLADDAHLPGLKADSLRYLGTVSERLGDLSAAVHHFEESLERYRRIGDRRGEGRTLNHLGNILLMQGDHAGGKQYYDQFLNISREIGDRWGEGQVIRNIGDTYLSQYDYVGASKYFEQALEITREIGNRTIESGALVGLGNVYLEQGEFTRAKNVFEQSLNISREIGNKPWEAKTLNQIGRYFHLQGDYLRAQTYYESALEIYEQLGNQLSKGRLLIDLCLLEHHLGNDSTSLEINSTALEILEQFSRPKYIGQVLTQAGRAHAGLGDFENAETKFIKARENFAQVDQLNLRMESQAGLVDLYLVRNETTAAMTYAEEILEHLESSVSDPSRNKVEQAGAVPGLEGTHDPFWIYLVCCRAMVKANDSRSNAFIKTAHDLIQLQAKKITDPDLQFSFLNNVRANQGIINLYSEGAAA